MSDFPGEAFDRWLTTPPEHETCPECGAPADDIGKFDEEWVCSEGCGWEGPCRDPDAERDAMIDRYLLDTEDDYA